MNVDPANAGEFMLHAAVLLLLTLGLITAVQSVKLGTYVTMSGGVQS